MKLYFALSFILSLMVNAASASTAITNVSVVDATIGLRENQTVIFDGDSILAVQPAALEVKAETVVDGSGKFLIPGLWDAHVHLTYDARLTDSMPALFLYYGVTSVRDTGGEIHRILPLVEKLRSDDTLAPRVFFSGPLLDGDHVVYEGKKRPALGIKNTTPAEVQENISQLKSQGVDFIKAYEMVSPEVFEAMIEAAREHSLPVAAHIPLSMTASSAGPPVDSIEHLRNIELECASNAVELYHQRQELLGSSTHDSGYALRSSLHKLQRTVAIENYDAVRCDEVIKSLGSTMQVPTLRLNGFALRPVNTIPDWEDALQHLPKEVVTGWLRRLQMWESRPDESETKLGEWSIFLVDRMHQRGTPIAAGTDTPLGLAVPGYSLHSELEMLVRAGLSPREALRAATERPAEFFSLQKEIGTIEPGKRADLVLLEANPLENISNTKRIAAVVTKGEYITRKQLSEIVRAVSQGGV